MAGKKKISKKELLKKPDEFITLSTRALNWAKENYFTVIGVTAGLVLILALYFGYSAYRNRQERLGHEKYFSSLEAVNPDQKLKQLEEIIRDYPRTKAAQSARVSAGHLYYQKKDFPRAVSSYQAALNQGKFPSSIKTLILSNLAYAYEQKGDLPQAAKTLLEITQSQGNLLKEDSLLNLARVYQKMGKKAEAKATYQTFLKEFPKSVYSNMVKDSLSKL
jgi:predicted negative regulator of RcsB-dependent stress response